MARTAAAVRKKRPFYRDLSFQVFVGMLLDATEKTRGVSSIYLDTTGTPVMIDGHALPQFSLDTDTDVKSDLRNFNAGITGGAGCGLFGWRPTSGLPRSSR